MGSLIEELRRREAAARAEADRLRGRVEPGGRDLVQEADVRPTFPASPGDLDETELRRRSRAVDDLAAALRRLRSVDTLAGLVDQTPIAIHSLGYRRALFSRVHGSSWSARSAFDHDDPAMAEALVAISQRIPGSFTCRTPESESLRRRLPVLVRNAATNPGVHRELRQLGKTTEYVVAPLVARGRVIGLIHADRHVATGSVATFDRQLLGLFAEGLGCIFDYVALRERIGLVGDRALPIMSTIDVDEGGDTERERAPRSNVGWAQPEGGSLLNPGPGPRCLPGMTRRELEVLTSLARGLSNPLIAEHLGVSAETVKTHVSKILHKLGVSSRWEAAALFRQIDDC